MPRSEKRWIDVQSYELCAREDGRVGLMLYIPSVQRSKSLFCLSRSWPGWRGYLCSIKQFDLIIAMYATEHVLSNTLALSTMLQGKIVDLLEAAQEARVVIVVREAMRRFGRKGMSAGNGKIGAEFDIEPCMRQKQLGGSNTRCMSQPQT